jgi:large subunit ribosomal protein L25
MLSVDTAELELVLKHAMIGRSLFNLVVTDGDVTRHTVMIRELQTEPVSRQFLHADFYEIDIRRKLVVQVPVTTVGKSKGVEMGGLLQVIRRELDVYCLPDKIPEMISIDVTDLGIGEAVHIEDIDVPEGVELPHEVNFTVVTVLGGRKAEVGLEEELIEEEEIEEGDVEESEAESE